MAWDTEATKRRILDAAAAEFAAHGPDGTTIERIAGVAGVNKERIYNYFGGKRDLFAHVLRDELVKVAQAVPVESFATEDVGEGSPSMRRTPTTSSDWRCTGTRRPPSRQGSGQAASPRRSMRIT